MTSPTLLVLVALWVVVLVPGALRDRRKSPGSTVDGFHATMERLAHCDNRSVLVPASGGGWLVHPRPNRRQLLLARRRMVALRLGGLAAATVFTALFGGGGWWWLASLSVLAFAGYLGALRLLTTQRAQAAKVVPLRAEPAATAPAAAAPTPSTWTRQPSAADIDDRWLPDDDLLFAGRVAVAAGDRA